MAQLFDRAGGGAATAEMRAHRLIAECRAQRNPTLDLTAAYAAEPGATIAEVPPEVFELTWLRSLSIRGNDITTVPDELGRLTHLEVLDISGNDGLVLTPAVGGLTSLRVLTARAIGGRKPHPLPPEVGSCRGLERFDVSGMMLGQAPSWLEHLHDLKTLRLKNNDLEEIRESLFLALPQLEGLDLEGNRLASLPDSLASLRRLRRLSLAQNHLSTLPSGIENLTSLQVVDLSHNRFRRLPPTIGAWHALHTLLLNNDLDITTELRWHAIDEDITDVQLYPGSPDRGIPSVSVEELPAAMRNLTRLRLLILYGNPALELPAELLGDFSNGSGRWDGSVPDILDYLDRTKQGSRSLSEARLVVLGWGGAGKTSIVNRLIADTFTEGEPRTEGIAVTAWPVALPDSSRATLNIWDFGGQEIMHATHQFFLTTRCVYLLVVNGRNGSADTDADYWLTVIESFAPGVPVVVALNQIERDPFDLDETGLRLRYPTIRAIVRTDCRSALGLDTLRQQIVDATDQLPDLRVQFPSAWTQIKNHLSGMTEDYLTFERYRTLCAELGEDGPEEQELLAGFLHRLGIALNYRDDPRLRDTHVLNPHWVTEGIYAILNARSISERHGELRLEQLGSVLDLGRYPPERHLFLLDLMRKFDLCFAYPDGSPTWLVPELLPKQQPESVADLLGPDDLRFEYSYPIVPEGLLPRFIARSHVHSDGSLRWRNGVVLRWEGNHAVVTADPSRQAVSISIGGWSASRRRLLAVVRSDFDALHSSYRFPIRSSIPVSKDGRRFAVNYEKLIAAERQGMAALPEFVDGEFISIDVRRMLGDVDFARPVGRYLAARVFVSYCHGDEEHRKHLDSQLKVLRREGLVQDWHDRRIEPGDHWRGIIDDELERADIMVCLVTPDFLDSDYCTDVEMRWALDRDTCRVIPVIVRDCMWRRTELGELQAVPHDGEPVGSAPNRDAAWREVGESIARAAEQIRR